MRTDLAISILEECGSSEDPIQLIGQTKKAWESYRVDPCLEPSSLDVNIENDAREIHIKYSSISKNKYVNGTLSGMVLDRLSGGTGSTKLKLKLKCWISNGEVCDNWCPICGQKRIEKMEMSETKRKALIALGQAESNGGFIPGSGHEGFILPGKFQAQLFSAERDELVKGDMVAETLKYGTLTSNGSFVYKRGYQITQEGINALIHGKKDIKVTASERNKMFGKPKKKKKK